MATRLQMRDRARVKADQENATYPTDASYNDWLNEAGGWVWRRLVAAGWTPGRVTVNLVANGSASYTLGTDVHSVRYVHRLDGTGTTARRIPLRRLRPEERSDAMPATGQAEVYDLALGVTAAQVIELMPIPASGTYEVSYVPRFAGFAADGDNWYGPDGTDELLVLLAAIRGVKKENGDHGPLAEELKDAWSEILDSANWVDQLGTPTVRDVYAVARITDSFDFDAVEGWK